MGTYKCNEDFGKIDLKKLEFVIRYLVDKDLLHSVALTGGEPMMYPETVNNIINLILNINPNIEIQISTNGYNLKELKNFDKINSLESIHISRHHYLDNKNIEIFNTSKIAKTDDIIDVQEYLKDKKIININTIVMKDYIDSLKEIKNMLNYVGELGVYKNGFVSLMKCNDFTKDKFINFNEIFNNLDDNFFKGYHFYSKNYCECTEGIYLTDKNKLVEYYARMVKECKCPYINQLVYTSDNKVTANFSLKVLYK